MNKRSFLILAVSALSFLMGGCIKGVDAPVNNCVPNNTGVPTATEIAAVQSYLTARSITATQHPDGFFYVKQAQGTGATPTSSSTITVKYTGLLTNGNVFDQNQSGTASFLLSSLILGWQKGLPLIQKGGIITLYLPYSLGYGCSQAGTIPPGSVTIFNIELIDVM